MSADTQYLQASATTNVNGSVIPTDGYVGAQQIEILETAGGTATVTLEGAFDGGTTNWYAVGYYRVDGQASLTRAASGIAVGANTARVYQLLDPYPMIRARISSISSATISVRMYRVN